MRLSSARLSPVVPVRRQPLPTAPVSRVWLWLVGLVLFLVASAPSPHLPDPRPEEDGLGRQLTLSDPDKGNWTYLNNALGQVVSQTDASTNATASTFDKLGRPLSRVTTGNGATETANFYYYDTSTVTTAGQHTVAKGAKGWIGAPEREEANATGSFSTVNLHYYDAKGRPALELAQSDGKWFYTATSYLEPGGNDYSRVTQVRHYWKPAGAEAPGTQPYVWQDYGYTYAYDGESYLLSLTDSLGRSWWDSPAYDHLDRVTSVKKGNGHVTTRSYRAEDGVLTGITTPGIQAMAFGFDGLGNLRSRTDTSVSGGTENFGYDLLNRLTGAGNTGTVAYLANGNIQTKNDVLGTASGTMTYDAGAYANAASSTVVRTLPHAVGAAFGYTFKYDLNGNLLVRTKAGDQSGATWTGFDQPRAMWRVNGATTAGSEFHYNARRSRVLQLEFDSVTGTFPAQAPQHYNRKRIYALGATLELNYNNTVTSGTGQDWALLNIRIYVPGPDGIIGTREFSRPSASTPNFNEQALVYHYDHLGSITAITDHGSTSGYSLTGGTKSGRYSEDAWGQRRDPSDWSGPLPPPSTSTFDLNSLTPRGFTGHEMLDDLGFVHMNGRIYDPLLGRMLSADLIVDNPKDLQGYNRYSYVKNRPLALTDPSGYSAAGEFFARSHPNADRHVLVKTFGSEKADRMITQRAEGQAAADKGTMIGGVVTVGIAVAIVAGPAVVVKEIGSEIIDTTVENATGLPMATSIRGLAKDLWQWGAKKLGKESAEAAGEVVTKKADELAGSPAAPAKLESATPDLQPAPELPANSLTPVEVSQTQAITDKYNTTIDVGGSRAAGNGHNIETNLPKGHDLVTNRSDIDFRVDAGHPEANDIITELKAVGNGAGSAAKDFSTQTKPTFPPYIRFTPDKPLEYVP